jgi:hypothetical protein
MTAANQKDFLRVVRALGPYLDQLVFVGAWCHRLQQFHSLATAPSFTPLMTEDADVATPERLQTRSMSLDTALTDGGFKARLSGDGQLPVMKYYPVGDESGLYVEFIAPLRGSGYTRKGEPDDLLEVAGITAQKLRYVELLLFEPWKLQLSEPQGFKVGTDDIVIQIANPASYLAQKVLTLNRRQNGAKRPKDALYIHDTLTMFGGEFGGLREQGARVLQLLPPKTQREFHELRVALFQDKSLMVRAAAIAAATGRANPPTADTIATVCTVGLESIFAP